MSEEAKEEKKKLIKIEGDKVEYTSSSVFFALVSSPEEGRKQATSFMSCRDHVTDVIRAHIHKENNGGLNSIYRYGTSPPIDMNKMRLLIYRHSGDPETKKKVNEKFRDKLFSGKAALNLYEKLAGWKESKITTVNHSGVGKQAWLITGPQEWMKAPNLLSMVTLIIRIASHNGPLDTDSIEDLNKSWERLIKTEFNNYDIASYLKTCWKKFEIIMKYYDEIFTDSIEKAYPNRDLPGSNHGRGGIMTLCDFNTGITSLDQRFKKVCDKYLK